VTNSWRFIRALAAIGFALVASAPSLAQDFPTRPVITIYPFSPGGGGDATARIIAAELSALWKQPIVVENKPGGSGSIGFNTLRNSKPDGHTLSYFHNGLLVIRRVSDPAFTADPGRDYEPVVNVFEDYTQIAANPSAPFKTMSEFISYVKANPGKVNIAMGGQGATDQVAAETLKQQAGLDFVLVPYNGSSRAVQGVIAGEVPAIVVSIPLFNQVAAKQLLPLGVAATQRISMLPGFQTFTEAGLPPIPIMNNWVGLFAPAGTPRDVVLKINQAMNTVFKNPEIRKKATVGGDLLGGSPEELSTRIRSEVQTFGPMIRKLNIKFD